MGRAADLGKQLERRPWDRQRLVALPGSVSWHCRFAYHQHRGSLRRRYRLPRQGQSDGPIPRVCFSTKALRRKARSYLPLALDSRCC